MNNTDLVTGPEWSSIREIEHTLSEGGIRQRKSSNFEGINCHLEPSNGTIGGLILNGRYKADQEHIFTGGSWIKIRIQLQGIANLGFDTADLKPKISEERLFVISHKHDVTKTQRFSAGSEEKILTIRFACDDDGLLSPDISAGAGERQALSMALTNQETLFNLALPPIIVQQAEIVMQSLQKLPHDMTQSRLLTLSDNCLNYITKRLLGRQSEVQMTLQRAKRIVAMAMEIIEADLTSPPTLTTLCRKVGVNRNILNHAFRQVNGETAYSVFRSKRMELARELLIGSERPICEIAHIVGYSQLANFSTAYRNMFGVAPSREFERRNRN